ncbi:MAB_1171c family putative transporter [Kitasatospora sp. NPDC101801]|uniref:MAB_1171c family putative transporter n=1 Tax=Kitasatospora sp. NPDC101801 TaxID=3364103 RepID=UPI00380EFF1F
MTPAPIRWIRAWTAYRRIGPLWAALHRAVPEIALCTPAARLRPAFPRGAEFALYRRIIEIHDGQLALRPYVHPGVHTWAVATAGRPGAGGNAAARAEAACIAAALAAAEAGLPYRAGPPVPYAAHQVQASIEAETAWLIDVTEAFTRSARAATIGAHRPGARHLTPWQAVIRHC